MTFKKLQQEYSRKGISLVVSRNKQQYFLSIKDVPYTVKGLKEGVCQLTGYFTIYSRDRLEDVESMTQEVFSEYKNQYANNSIMLSYVQ